MSQLTALILTVLIELGAVSLMYAVYLRHERRDTWVTLLVTCAAASLLTHPLAWALNMQLPLPFVWRFALIEAAVTLAEAALYARFAGLEWRLALFCSMSANATSATTGIALYYLNVV